MLVTVLATAMILSVTGVAVMEFGLYGRTEAFESAHTIENQYTVEGHVNKALWRVNTMADSLISYTEGPVTVTYDTSAMRLFVGVSQFDEARTVTADLVEDNHFRHAIATNDTLLLNGYDLGNEPQNTVKGEFRFLPQIDLQYFIDSAVAVHDEDYYWYDQADFSDEGIHVFTGEDPVLNSVTLHNSTVVFTSSWVWFYKDCDIRAEVNLDEQLPAVVLTNPDIVFVLNREWGYQDNIEGAIWCAGKIRIKRGTISGPIVANKAVLKRDMDLTDDAHPEFYNIWYTGFGSYASYDWPKVLTNWDESYVD